MSFSSALATARKEYNDRCKDFKKLLEVFQEVPRVHEATKTTKKSLAAADDPFGETSQALFPSFNDQWGYIYT